ncbi:MAG: hypothetical protein HQL76_08840 [Magnetococcales bacterium]|nr:hypothetical protein [Magnetococcales bacterium]
MSDTSAIPLDAETEPERPETPPWDTETPSPAAPHPPEETPPVDERLEALNRIARRNHERNETPARPEPTFPEAAAADRSDESDKETPSQNGSMPPGTRDGHAETMPVRSDERVPVTIDGKTELLPLDTVVRGYQIEAAARKRLGAAASIFKRLKQRESSLVPSGHPSLAVAPTPPPSQGRESATETTSIQEMEEYLQQSEPEQPRPAIAPVDPEQLAEYVFLRQEVRSEKQRLIDAQPHIARDARLSGMHANIVMETMEAQPGLPTRDYFDHATEAINQWLLQLTTARLSRTSDTGQRLMDKREATNKQAPMGIHRKVSSGTDAPAPPTYADKIRQMKQARGLT